MEEERIELTINGRTQMLNREEFVNYIVRKANQKFNEMIQKQEKKLKENGPKFTKESDEKLMERIKELTSTAYKMDALFGGTSYEAIHLFKELSTEKLKELNKEKIYTSEYADEIKRVLKERGVNPEEVNIEEVNIEDQR